MYVCGLRQQKRIGGGNQVLNLPIGQEYNGAINAVNTLSAPAYLQVIPTIFAYNYNYDNLSITSNGCDQYKDEFGNIVLQPGQGCTVSYKFIPNNFEKYTINELTLLTDKEYQDTNEDTPNYDPLEAILAGKIKYNLNEININASPDGHGTPPVDIDYAYPADNATVGMGITGLAEGDYEFSLQFTGSGQPVIFKPATGGNGASCLGEIKTPCNIADNYTVTVPAAGCCLEVGMALNTDSVYPLTKEVYDSYLIPAAANADTKIQRLKFFIQ